MKNTFLGISIALLLTGCTTTPTPMKEASQTPSNRLMAYQEKKIETTSTIVITRDVGYTGGACYYAVSINGTLAARLDTGETSRFFVAPGEVLLGAGQDPQAKGLCALAPDQWTQRESILRPNEMKFFRLTIDANGRAEIQRAD